MLPGAELHEGASNTDLDVVAKVLGEAVGALEGAGIRYLLIGGLASGLLGRPRCSADIDLLVRPADASPALEALGKAGFRTERTNPHWLFKAFRHEVLVDLLFKASGMIYADDEMLDRATLRSFRGVPVRVAPAEDLIVIKAIVHDEETPRHWGDALGLIAAGGLDWEYLRRRAQFGPRRVLSLLLYALSVDLLVPRSLVEELVRLVLEDREWNASSPT